MTLNFQKLVGAGNDFIFFEHSPNFTEDFYKQKSIELCDRNFGIGADGIAGIEVVDKDKALYRWHFFNNDGSSAEMCGNAARCSARYIKSVHGESSFTLESLSGDIKVKDLGDEVFTSWKLKSSSPDKKTIMLANGTQVEGYFIDTGVPHFVILNKGDVFDQKTCLEIQYHEEFQPDKTNVTLLDVKQKNFTKSFERGVEDFTLACGTGVIAGAFALRDQKQEESYFLQAPGGAMKVQIDGPHVSLVGPAKFVFSGSTEI